MNFKEAFRLMKEGEKIKLPYWSGYWRWDEEKETIMMHCRPTNENELEGPIIDIRDTLKVEYTISNILHDDWEIATEENTPLLGGKLYFNIGYATMQLKKGYKVCRKAWAPREYYMLDEHDNIIFNQRGEKYKTQITTIDDILADDWMYYLGDD